MSKNQRNQNNRGTNKPETTVVFWFSWVPYCDGLKIAKNSGFLESYKKRCPTIIADLDSEDEGFWDWAHGEKMTYAQTTNRDDARTLIRRGLAAYAIFEEVTNG
jgi:hypothetical protein